MMGVGMNGQGEDLEQPGGGSDGAAEEPHIQYRECAACGSQDMAPLSDYASDGLMGITDRGQIYQCPQCDAQAPIRPPSALFIGAIMALFWGAVAYWAFTEGPLWYGQHFSLLIEDGLSTNLLIDIVVLLFYLLVLALSLWMIWSDLVSPLLIRAGHGKSHENRIKTGVEKNQDSASRLTGLLSFFVFSLLCWLPLLGVVWLLDQFGVDLRGDGASGYLTMGLGFGLVVLVGRRNPLIFFGMVFWMAAAVAAIFTFG